jgi:hypothetical protein
MHLYPMCRCKQEVSDKEKHLDSIGQSRQTRPASGVPQTASQSEADQVLLLFRPFSVI